jgi:hypothetical protein
MTIERLMGLVGKTGRIVPTKGKPEWPGPFTVVAVDPGRVALDEIEGHKYSGPTLDVESVARRVQSFPDGRPPVETEEPAERSWLMPADWFVPQD